MTRSMNTRIGSMILLLTAVTLSGCLQIESCRSSGDQDFQGKTLTILDHGAYGNFNSIQPLFENLTGARLRHIEAQDAGEALRQAIDNKGNPVADLLYAVDNLLIHDAAEAGIFEDYESPNLAALNENVSLDDFRLGGRLLATPIDHGYINVNYDIALRQTYSQGELPQTLRELAQREWASKLVVEDPRLSTPGLGFLAITVFAFGTDGDYTYRDYWRDLFGNGALVVDDWTQAYVYHYTGGYGKHNASTFIGDRPFVVSYTTSPAVEVLFGAESPPGVSFEPADGVFHQVETIGILKCTKHRALAQAFIDFALTQPYQETIAPEYATYPSIRGVDLPQAFRDHATDPSLLPTVPFDAPRDGPMIGTWIEDWKTVYQAAFQ